MEHMLHPANIQPDCPQTSQQEAILGYAKPTAGLVEGRFVLRTAGESKIYQRTAKPRIRQAEMHQLQPRNAH